MAPASRKRRPQPQEEESESEQEPTQSTQRNKRRRTPVDSSEEQGEDDDSPAEEMEQDDNGLEASVKKLVRYALACEYQRQTIKRAGINEKVIGKQRGLFKPIFDRAQDQLRTKFGMEMVELPARDKVTTKQKRAAASSTSQSSKSSSSASYILRTILPPEYRVPEIMPPSNIGSASDEAAYIGLSTVLVSLVAMGPDNQLPKHALDKYMERLGIDKNTGIGKSEDLIKRMKQDSYIHEFKLEGGDNDLAYRVGPRGRMEIGSQGVKNLVKAVYTMDGTADGGKDLDKRLQRSLGMDGLKIENNVEAPKERRNGSGTGNGEGSSRRSRRSRANEDEDSE